ncbi:MAG: sodium-dependent transporter [Spongiibacteraceae bacterium]
MPFTRTSIHGGWTSEWTFVAAATSSAIGLGSLWRFAYLAGMHGGAGFVLMYLVCALLVAAPVMVALVVLGARGRADPIHAVQMAALESAVSRHWRAIGYLSVIASLLILSYFSVIGGWLLVYVRWLYQGDLAAASARQIGEQFGQLLADTPVQLFAHFIFMASVWLVVAFGVRRGVGLLVRVALPALLILLLMLVLYAFRMGNMTAALNFLFAPTDIKFTWDSALVALGQAFFSFSLSMGGMMTYGAYVPDRRPLMRLILTVILIDTAVAVLAGLAIFPLVFAQRLEPSVGPGLMFVTLPYIFGNVQSGGLVGTAFFMLVLLAALGSAIALLEPGTAWLVQRLRWRRPLAALVLAGVSWALGLLTIFSFSLWPNWRPGGKSLFAWIDWFSASILLPLCGLSIAIFVGWRMRREASRDELFVEHPRVYALWRFLLRYIAPPAIAGILLGGIYKVWVG